MLPKSNTSGVEPKRRICTVCSLNLSYKFCTGLDKVLLVLTLTCKVKTCYNRLQLLFYQPIYTPLLNLISTLSTVLSCSVVSIAPRLLYPGKNTGAGCHFLLQGIFSTQGSNPHLPSPTLAGGFFTIEPPEKPS